jgi:molybdopterin biosynthesis enzyme
MRVAAIVSETLGSEALGAFRTALSGKLKWFGSVLVEPQLCANEAAAIADALRAVMADGAELVLFAGTRAMDPMDAAFGGLEQAGARMQRSGVPVHPGSFLWLARLDAIPVLGVPSCGLFSKTTSIDLLIARAHAGYSIDAAALARLGNGGLLGDATAYRLPSYGVARRGAPD